MSYQLIAFDMDGTLLDSNKQIRPDSLEAIKAATAAGKIVCLSTGRSLPELAEPLQQLPQVQFVIGISGALVFQCGSPLSSRAASPLMSSRAKSRDLPVSVISNRTNVISSAVERSTTDFSISPAAPVEMTEYSTIFSRPLSHDLVTEMFCRIRGQDLMVHLHSDHSLVQADHEPQMEKYGMGVYQKMFDKITSKIEDLEAFVKQERPPVYKFNLYCQTPQQRTQMEKLLSDLPLTIVHAEHTSLECSAAGVSKGNGLIQLCRHLNLPVEQTIAVGDADNDLDILKKAGLAVAMGNANEKVKSISDVVVPDNDSGGCARAIYEYLLA